MEEILRRYREVFKEELGVMREFKATIHVNPTSIPSFCRARPIQYAMRYLVKKEVDKVVSKGVIEPVAISE